MILQSRHHASPRFVDTDDDDSVESDDDEGDDDAGKVVEKLCGSAPKIKGMCRNEMFDDAFSFFSDMKVKAHPLNRPVYTMMIIMCYHGGRFVDGASYLVPIS
ncbi:hypothetical protein Bca4012_011792 [Brassica carinata]|uniref:Pentatricopeptide repeat-containing protein n=1 Tax=Brassica carinata TaxID=52824 RepID=A0A8X7V577_BRACI|nr:hypothetical protein Bca52824_036673 [Brassica carinata]